VCTCEIRPPIPFEIPPHTAVNLVVLTHFDGFSFLLMVCDPFCGPQTLKAVPPLAYLETLVGSAVSAPIPRVLLRETRQVRNKQY